MWKAYRSLKNDTDSENSNGISRLHQGGLLTAQVTALVVICAAGQLVVRTLNLPIPGFLLGMVFLFVLLVSGAPTGRAGQRVKFVV